MRTASGRAAHPSGATTRRARHRVGSATLAALLGIATLAAALGGCSDERASGPCDEPERQPAQMPSSHVLPGQPEPSYLSDPPTSGPHAPLTSVPPVFAEPVPKPTQVGILERGMVLVQYRPDLPPAAQQQLLGLAGGPVAVAPNPQLDRPIVASAWLYLLRCDAVDTAALGDFVATHTSGAPGGH